jgi:hypothetical protein
MASVRGHPWITRGAARFTTFTRIGVAPFTVEYAGLIFGLAPREPEEPDDVWAVEAQPGNYMAFFEPWDSGEYDT